MRFLHSVKISYSFFSKEFHKNVQHISSYISSINVTTLLSNVRVLITLTSPTFWRGSPWKKFRSASSMNLSLFLPPNDNMEELNLFTLYKYFPCNYLFWHCPSVTSVYLQLPINLIPLYGLPVSKYPFFHLVVCWNHFRHDYCAFCNIFIAISHISHP